MGSLQVVSYIEGVVDDNVVQFGKRTVTNVTITTKLEWEKTIGTQTTIDAWQSDSEILTDFDLLAIETDSPVFVELTCDYGGDNGDEYLVIPLIADIPFILAADDSFANYTLDFGGSLTADVIDRIRIRNNSASATAKVHFLIGT